MPVSLHATEHPIHEVFSNRFVFSIPRYQRPYAWTTEQAGLLVTDLLAAIGDINIDVSGLDPYFLGSIVLIKEDKQPPSEVVDGQQRLTTLTILLSVLRHLVPPDSTGDLTPFIYEKGNTFTNTPDRYRLSLRERDIDFFQDYVQKPGGIPKLLALNVETLSDSQKNIALNAASIHQILSALDTAERDRLTGYLLQRCFLVVVSTPDFDSAYRIFSVLNDRGLDLTTPDILKSEIIGMIPQDKAEAYAGKWEDAEEDLGREAFKELFTHIRTIYRKLKLQSTILKEFRQYVEPTKEPRQFVDNVLLPYAEAFAVIGNASYEYQHADEINTLLSWLNRIDNFDWVPPAMLFYSKCAKNPTVLLKFLTKLERLAASMMVRRANVNERMDRYAKVLTTIEQGADIFASNSPLELEASERADTIQALDGPIYLMQALSRQYVLLRLDAALSSGGASYDHKIITVEHVLPQNPPSGSLWLNWFPAQADRDHYLHRIGNLALLTRRKNSEAQNFEFTKKKQLYFTSKKGTSPFVLTTQVLQEEKWTADVVERRQRMLVATLQSTWQL